MNCLWLLSAHALAGTCETTETCERAAGLRDPPSIPYI